MPLHIAPPIRALEEVREQAGQLIPTDSSIVATAKLDEAASRKTKVVPLNYYRIINGVVYKPT